MREHALQYFAGRKKVAALFGQQARQVVGLARGRRLRLERECFAQRSFLLTQVERSDVQQSHLGGFTDVRRQFAITQHREQLADAVALGRIQYAHAQQLEGSAKIVGRGGKRLHKQIFRLGPQLLVEQDRRQQHLRRNQFRVRREERAQARFHCFALPGQDRGARLKVGQGRIFRARGTQPGQAGQGAVATLAVTELHIDQPHPSVAKVGRKP